MEKLLACAIEGSVEESEKDHGIFTEDLSVEIGDCAGNVDALED
jgi:hypothetical protein